MKRIDPYALYETHELKEILAGFASVEYLRCAGGLKGLPGRGYFGASVLAALERVCDNASQPQGLREAESETRNVEFNRRCAATSQLFENRETPAGEEAGPGDLSQVERTSNPREERSVLCRPPSQVQPSRGKHRKVDPLTLRFKRRISALDN